MTELTDPGCADSISVVFVWAAIIFLFGIFLYWKFSTDRDETKIIGFGKLGGSINSTWAAPNILNYNKTYFDLYFETIKFLTDEFISRIGS